MGDGRIADLGRPLSLAYRSLIFSAKGAGQLRKYSGLTSIALIAAGFIGSASPALAYRPFDGTDPDVADPGEFEIEASPLSYLHDDSGEVLIGPQLKFNYGIAPRWELVVEGQAEHPQTGGSHSAVVDNAVFLKTVLREGSLQGRPGLSLATEFGGLLPGINDQSGLGFEWAAIAGYEAVWGAIHLTFAAALNREEKAEIFFSTIVEGPGEWRVRPVAELFYEREFHTTEIFSALGGFIWQARDDLSFDFAVRQADVNGSSETELRFGLTYAFSLR